MESDFGVLNAKGNDFDWLPRASFGLQELQVQVGDRVVRQKRLVKVAKG